MPAGGTSLAGTRSSPEGDNQGLALPAGAGGEEQGAGGARGTRPHLHPRHPPHGAPQA